jgi:DNA-binding beta-propeller fold protein YncE
MANDRSVTAWRTPRRGEGYHGRPLAPEENAVKKPCKAALAVALAFAFPAAADLAVSAHDNKAYTEGGATKTYPNPAPDNIAVIDMSASPPKVLAHIEVPASVVGPPSSVAVSRDESFALVTSAQKVDPADATKTIADNRVSIIDLRANPPRVVGTAIAGAGASGVSINREGTLALVANRNEGTVSAFTIANMALTPVGKVKLGDEKSGPSHVAITPDGKRAVVTRDGDHYISMLAIDGSNVTDAKRDFGAGLRPYGLDIASDGSIAVVANVGRNTGDSETVSLVDLRMNPPRVVDSVGVGMTPEGITLSPDGRIAAVVTHNGSAKAKNSPFYNGNGKVVLLRIEGGKLTRFAEAPIGTWSQGSAFSRDGKTLLVQNMVEKDIQVLRLEGDKLTDTGQRIKVNGGPVAIRTAW